MNEWGRVGVLVALLYCRAGIAQPDHLHDVVYIDGEYIALYHELLRSDGEMSPDDERKLLEAGMDRDTVRALKSRYRRLALRGERGRKYLVIPLGETMTPTEVEIFGWLLGLSDAQQKFLEHEYDSYMTFVDSVWPPVVTPIRDRSADYLEFEEGPDSLEQLLKDVEKANRQLMQFDESLYTALIPALTEHQIEQLPRLRMLRRRNALSRLGPHLPGARIDLLTGYFTFHEQNETYFPNSSGIENVLAEYQRRATSLVERHRRADDETQVEYKRHQLTKPTWQSLPEDVRAAIALAFSDKTRRIHREKLGLEESLLKLNESTLEKLVVELEPGPAKRFSDWFVEHAYPHVYPYDERPELFLEDLIAVEDRVEEEVETLRAILRDLITQIGAINSRMESEYLRWRVLTGERHGFHHGEYDEYQVEMQALLERRYRAMERAIVAADPFIRDEDARNGASLILEDLKKRTPPSIAPGGLGWPGPYDPPPQRRDTAFPVGAPGAGG